jgi:hypothetical protein
MELFIPGLIVFIVAAIFIFLILPRLGTTVLVVACIIALIAAGINHYSMFYGEYSLSTWQNGVAAYAPWIILVIAFFFIIAAIIFIFKGGDVSKISTPMALLQSNVQTSVENMPAASTATNPLTAAINSGINAVASPVGPVNNALKAANNASRAPNGSRPPNGQRAPNGSRVNNSTKAKSPNIPGAGFPASQL